MENTYYLDLIGRYLSGAITAEEKAELMAWVEESPDNKALFEEMVQLWSVSSQYQEPPFRADKEAAWASLTEKLDAREKKAEEALTGKSGEEAKVVRMNPLRVALRYAAVLILLLAAGYFLFFPAGSSAPEMISLQTGPDEQREVELPDGSLVSLNENTALSYSRDFEERRVTLSGEAFFNVQKRNGKTFTIEAEGSTTTVLGTSFNLRAYPAEEKVSVSVKTGKVALQKSADEAERVLIKPGEAAVYDKRTEKVEAATISNATAWKEKYLNFDNARLEYVIEALERYFGVDIEVANRKLLDCEYLGEYPDPKLDDILKGLSFTMDLEVEQQNGKLVLKGDASHCR